MALESMKRMLREARDQHFAIGAFNILDYTSMKAVVRAAEALKAPVIIQTSAKTVEFWSHRTIMSWVEELTQNTPVPVALHLDHCKDLNFIQQCIDAGWTSVMIDASSKPFEENIQLTAQVVAMAARHNVSVEAELGEIGGVEDDLSVADQDAHLVDPVKAEKFCKELSLDCFAPAIGTAHGLYKGEPRIAFDRLAAVANRTSTPLALHGGTGLSADVFNRCITSGCAKVNISTQLKHSFIDDFIVYHQAHATEYNPLKVLDAQYAALKRIISEKIEVFGGVGKAV